MWLKCWDFAYPVDRTLWPCINKVMTMRPRMSSEAMSRYAMVAYERQQKQAVVESALRRQAERDHEEQCRVAASMEAAPSSKWFPQNLGAAGKQFPQLLA